MNRSTLMNHINHLSLEIKELEVKANNTATTKNVDTLKAVMVYDTTIAVLKKRLEECKKELEDSSNL
tara:strand:- start:1308 stop:1508 length:201 start_codon:yes stop_codon:yes gene_type:complete